MLKHKKLGGLAAVVALVAAMMAGLFVYTGTGTASADESSCTINECVTNAAIPDEATLRRALTSNKNGAFFWTGRVNGKSVEQDALRIAQASEFDGITLEGALARAGIVMPPFSDTSPDAAKVWKLASKIFAEQASGDAFVVMGDQIREGNVFEDQEFPALRRNPKIQRVIRMDNSGRELEPIFDRDKNPNDGDQDGEDDPQPDPSPGEPSLEDAIALAPQEDNSRCVDTADAELGTGMTLRSCNGTIRQLFLNVGDKFALAFDTNLCLHADPGFLSADDQFANDVKAVPCDSATTWQIQDDGTIFNNNNRGCLTPQDRRVDEGVAMRTANCANALTWTVKSGDDLPSVPEL